MSSLSFFPIRWSINSSWTRVFCYGKTSPNERIGISLPLNPSLLFLGSSIEIDSYVMNGFLSQPPDYLGKGVYRLSFSNRKQLQDFTRSYHGPGKVIKQNPLRSFFRSQKLSPGNWQEILDLETGEFPSQVPLNFHSRRIRTLEGREQISLNLFLFVDCDEVSLTAEYLGQNQSHSFRGTHLIKKIIEDCSPDSLIYFITPESDYCGPEDSNYRKKIDWSRLEDTRPTSGEHLLQLWTEGQWMKKLREWSNFWSHDITEHLEEDIEKEAFDLIQGLDPSQDLSIQKPQRGVFRDVYWTPIQVPLGTLGDYFLHSEFEYLLIQLGLVQIPSLLWVDKSRIVTRKPISEESQVGLLAIISESDRVLQTEKDLFRSGMGPLTYPPFPLFEKAFLQRIKGERPDVPDVLDTSDFAISIRFSLSQSVPPYTVLAKQLQEGGQLSSCFRQNVSYIQTFKGPILLELINQEKEKWLDQIDIEWYERYIQEILGNIFPSISKLK